MKLRMKDNSLRIRITQSELNRLTHEGEIKACTRLGPDPTQVFHYGLRLDEKQKELGVNYHCNVLMVTITASMMAEWKEDDKVGFDAAFDIGDGAYLQIVIEKDFKCLHPGKNREPELDNYPHPMAQ